MSATVAHDITLVVILFAAYACIAFPIQCFIRYHRRRRKRPASTFFPTFLPILEEMAEIWQGLTEDDIARAERQLDPIEDGELKLGVLHSQEVRRMYALGLALQIRAAQAEIHSKAAASDEQAKYLIEQSRRFAMLSQCSRELFWAQSRDDVGGQAWEPGSVSIRRGWMYVRSKQARDLPDLAKLFGGS